jgi:hypothetical protein
MTIEELKKILAGQPSEVVQALQKSSYDLPKWADLAKQYDPLLHEIKVNTKRYPIKLNEFGYDDFKRITIGLQKLAVNRIAQAMFTNPVERMWNNAPDNEREQTAINIVEQIYKVENYMDSENIERCKKWGASCQFATIWKTYEEPNEIEGEVTKLKLTHTTYSEMDGYKLYAQNDENGNLIVLLILYKDSNSKDHAYVYAKLETPVLQVFDNGEGGWALNAELSKPLSVFPAIHLPLNEAVWGGLPGTTLVEEIEELLSFNGSYFKKNAAPLFTQDMGDTTGMQKITTEEKSDDFRRIIRTGKGGSMRGVTWDGAPESRSFQYKTLREAFFEQVQMPDISFANMMNGNALSADSKEMLFADAKNKAQDLGGEWARILYNEMMLILEFAKIMFPGYVVEFSKLRARSVIKPYTIRSKKENAEYINLAGENMSRTTKIRILGEVDNIEDEVNEIEQEISLQANQGL